MGQILSKNIAEEFKTVLSTDSSIFIGSSIMSGKDRAKRAIKAALSSRLSKGAKITNSELVLLLITSSSIEITLDEISEINDYIKQQSGNKTKIIITVAEDNNLEEAIGITIIANGFDSINNYSEDSN